MFGVIRYFVVSRFIFRCCFVENFISAALGRVFLQRSGQEAMKPVIFVYYVAMSIFWSLKVPLQGSFQMPSRSHF